MRTTLDDAEGIPKRSKSIATLEILSLARQVGHSRGGRIVKVSNFAGPCAAATDKMSTAAISGDVVFETRHVKPCIGKRTRLELPCDLDGGRHAKPSDLLIVGALRGPG